MKCICSLCGKKFNTMFSYSDICDSCLSSSTDIVDSSDDDKHNTPSEDTEKDKSNGWKQLSFNLFD